MTRNIPRLLLTGALLFPATLYALGLGEIHLNSALTQPFDADIDLLSPTPEELTSLKVGLADQESFARSGIDRPSYLNNFTFKVVPTGDGRAVVRVTSTKPISEPMISLLLEASWARGKWIRQYTVFLDPPVFVPVQPAPQAANEGNRSVTPPPVEPSRNEGVIERTPSTVTSEPSAPEQPKSEAPVPAAAENGKTPPPITTTPAESPPEPASSEPIPSSTSVPTPSATSSAIGDSYDVQRNDSLWKIASRLRPGKPQIIDQTMIALYRANPSAFAGNINRLRSGAVLRIPSEEDMTAVDTHAARAEVKHQYEEWRPPAAAAIEEPDADRGHLRLVTPTEPAASVESTANAKAAEDAQKAEQAKQLADEVKRETDRVAAETQQRAADADAKRLLDIKNAELAKAQQAAALAAAKEKADAAAKAEAEAKIAETQPATTPAEAVPAAETTAPPQVEAPTPAVAKPTPKPVESPSLMDTLVNLPWIYIAAGLAILALLGAWVWNSRRRPDHDRSLHFPMPETSVPTMTQADFDAEMSEPAAEPTRRRYTEVPPEDIEESDLGGAGPESFEDADSAAPLQAASDIANQPRTSRIDDTMSSETAVHVDQQDAVAEADFHMAYGLYDQAADLVKIALAREPTRRDLKLKLLEIYFVWGNKELFIETARDLHSSRDQAPAGEWDKILIMGKQIAPQDSLFQGSSVSSSAGDNLDVNLEGGENRVDFDLFSTPEAGESDAGSNLDFEVDSTGARAKASSHLDFLLEDSGNSTVDDDTREMDANARTQETPTIESPILDRREETLREKTGALNFSGEIPASEQTAELSIDDLGLDVGSLESTGSLERTTALTRKKVAQSDDIGDDELTRIAPASAELAAKLRPSKLEPTMEVPQLQQAVSRKPEADSEEHDGSGTDVSVSTIYLEQLETSSGDVVDSLGPRGDETAHMLSPEDLDIDLSKLSDTDASDDDTIRRKASRLALEATAEHPRPKVDRSSDVVVATTAHPEMEPVTMSEVGTKLDLARAYMDMGDPDGARSILEEVLGEGNSGQRAEAQRLLDSIR